MQLVPLLLLHLLLPALGSAAPQTQVLTPAQSPAQPAQPPNSPRATDPVIPPADVSTTPAAVTPSPTPELNQAHPADFDGTYGGIDPCILNCISSNEVKGVQLTGNASEDCIEYSTSPQGPFEPVKEKINTCLGLDECSGVGAENDIKRRARVENFCQIALAKAKGRGENTIRNSNSSTNTSNSSNITEKSGTTSGARFSQTSAVVMTNTNAADSTASAATAQGSSNDKEEKVKKGGLAAGAIAGIVIGILLLFAIASGAFWLVTRNRRNHRDQARAMALEPAGMMINAPGRPRAGWGQVDSSAETPTSWRGFESVQNLPRRSTGGSFGASYVDEKPPAVSTRNIAGLTIDPNAAAPAFSYTAPTPNLEGPPSPVSPVTPYAPHRGEGSDTSSVISYDDMSPVPHSLPLDGRFSTEPPPQESLTMALPQITIEHPPSPPPGVVRPDTVAWRSQVESAQTRASQSIVQSEQEDAMERQDRKSSSSNFGTLAKRWSKGKDRDSDTESAPASPSLWPSGPGGNKRSSDASTETMRTGVRKSAIVIV